MKILGPFQIVLRRQDTDKPSVPISGPTGKPLGTHQIDPQRERIVSMGWSTILILDHPAIDNTIYSPPTRSYQTVRNEIVYIQI